MMIKTEIIYWCPSGFYCKDCGRRKSYDQIFGTYCSLYGLRLDVDASGKLLKCEKCLLAEREQRKESKL